MVKRLLRIKDKKTKKGKYHVVWKVVGGWENRFKFVSAGVSLHFFSNTMGPGCACAATGGGHTEVWVTTTAPETLCSWLAEVSTCPCHAKQHWQGNAFGIVHQCPSEGEDAR